MTTAAFQKGDRIEFKEFPEAAEGKIVALWKRGFYKVAWESGLTYQPPSSAGMSFERSRAKRILRCRGVQHRSGHRRMAAPM